MFKVAVLMATYNGAPWIRDQLISIAHQEGVSIKVFISDDGSTDQTLREVAALSDYLAVEILPARLGEKSPALNFLYLIKTVDLDSFDFVFFADQDDVWNPHKVKTAIERMNVSMTDCYASNLMCTYPDGSQKLLRKNFLQTDSDYLFQSASAGCTYGLSLKAALQVRAVLDGLMFPSDIKASHDWLIYAVTRSRGFLWSIDGNATIAYRQHSGNAWGALGINSYLKRWILLRNGWYRKNVIFVASLCHLGEHQATIIQRLTRWNFQDRIWLALHSHSFRRRPLEKTLLACLILGGIF